MIDKAIFKPFLQAYANEHLKPSKGKNKYCCPICNSGNKQHGTGALSIDNDTNTWKCFSCNAGGDVLDLIGYVEHKTEFIDQIKRASELFNIDIEEVPEHKSKPISKKAEIDYTEFFLQAKENIKDTKYLEARGISKAVAEAFNIGFMPKFNHPKASPNTEKYPFLIIPTSKYSYVMRDTREIDESMPEELRTQDQQRYYKVGRSRIFNLKALYGSKPCFIVEGEIDALSIYEAGAEAVALGSTTQVKNLLEILKENKPTRELLINLDNDEAGQKATQELIKGLQKLDIEYYEANVSGTYKDANEALVNERDEFIKRVKETEHTKDEILEQQRQNYIKNNTLSYVNDFLNGIKESVNTQCIPTYLSLLDSYLDGGLYEGLYTIGAVSSLGKTTLITQIADNIAQSGKDVLFISLEMARSELIAKSISRLTFINSGYDSQQAKTARGITTGKRYQNYSEKEKELITGAVEKYKEFAPHMFIVEGMGELGVKQVREAVNKHKLFTGNTPVVIIDYLQILAPWNERATDKQNTDKAVMELKRISRDYKTPVIVISSLNRANYEEGITMQAFKESGAIEYSSDVLIGLQFKGAGEKGFNVNNAKTQAIRNIELVVLKNRNGQTGGVIDYQYYPMFNYYREIKR